MEHSVVLVYPYFQYKDPVDKLFPPLGVAYLASQLRAYAIEVGVIDCTFETMETALERIVSLNPAIVGISVMVTLSRRALELAGRLRAALPEALLVAGGPLPSVYPHRFFPQFDLVFQGESDLIFPGFCRDYLQSRDRTAFLEQLDVDDYPGLCRQTSGGILSSAAVHHEARILDRLPRPDRSVFPHDRYRQHWHRAQQPPQTSIMVTRGCPYSCDFCSKPVWGSVYRQLDLEGVFLEINEIMDLGYERLWIADDSFTYDRAYLREFCEQKLARGIEIAWTCLSRTRGIDQDTADLMREAGCEKIYLGLESGSDETLRLMGKNSTVQEGIEAVQVLTQAGIRAAGFFIVGYPGESVDSIEKTFALALNLPFEEISINVPLPLPGSALYARFCHLISGEDWETASAASFVYETEHDQDWLRGRIKETLARFNGRVSRGRGC